MQNTKLTIETVPTLPSGKISFDDDFGQNALHAAPLPSKIIGDKIRLQQVLVNLVKNALKFSFNKPIKIVACFDHGDELLKVHVRDKGRGIKEKDLGILFRMFGKLDDSSDVNEEGIGMGLTICQKIVKNQKGKIECYSEGIGKGSTFSFSMKMQMPKRYEHGLTVVDEVVGLEQSKETYRAPADDPGDFSNINN